ncbi:MAG: hypothetical protein GDA49_13825 [Rhodospirillales bacterium]|nr:hypothetical protein [Rhodospirillales bacterium]
MINTAGADRRAIDQHIAHSLMIRPSISMAMPTVPLPKQESNFLEAPIRNSYHPARSGDIHVVQSPYSFLMDEGPITVMHGSPWRYDTHVPIISAGPGIEPTSVSRKVGTIDIAPTCCPTGPSWPRVPRSCCIWPTRIRTRAWLFGACTGEPLASVRRDQSLRGRAEAWLL